MIDIQSLLDKIPSGDARDPAVLEAYQNWMMVCVAHLKHMDPSRSKKACRRIAQSEWIELRRLQKRAERGRPERTGCWRGGRVV
jgi:hypothetical protein